MKIKQGDLGQSTTVRILLTWVVENLKGLEPETTSQKARTLGVERVLEKSKVAQPRGRRKQDRFRELGEHRAGTW